VEKREGFHLGGGREKKPFHLLEPRGIELCHQTPTRVKTPNKDTFSRQRQERAGRKRYLF